MNFWMVMFIAAVLIGLVVVFNEPEQGTHTNIKNNTATIQASYGADQYEND